ncbi:hypothetical protein Acr_08g0005440 [Actinidia rufa]|uniref:Uncharacterized protein n=1 Tax=Actinidia rufa TaxID=165716 RepID=A0A7J0F0C8_9ERIC|nr:hypothetical protein Acr_08g0005440 [Actinidia rufa]
MAFFSAVFNCFVQSLPSSQVSDDASSQKMRVASSVKLESKSPKTSSRAPIVVSYFPVSSNLSRL